MALAFDVITDILCRLPVKTLLRFRSLSKTCCSLIENSNFIKLHLNQSIQTNTNLDLIIIDDKGLIYATDLDSDSKYLSPVELDSPYGYWPHVIGSCNGLLAMRVGKDISLWNPSTNKYQIFPQFRSKRRSNYILDGFGYDVINDDYKVMMMMNKTKRVMVYSLKGNCSTTIDGLIDYKFCAFDSKHGVFVGGSLHWIVNRQRNKRTNDQLMLAFDLRDDRFREVPIYDPDEYEKQSYYSVMIGELGGCLSLSYTYNFHVDIWIMKGYGIAESWTKLICLTSSMVKENIARHLIIPLCYSKSGDKVLLLYNQLTYYFDYILIYDLKEERIVERINVDGGGLTKVAASICVTSLVTPNVSATIAGIPSK